MSNILTISDRYFEGISSGNNLYRTPKASWKLTDWVIKYSATTSTTKLVSSTIASFYSKREKYSMVGYSKLQAATGLSENAIHKAIEKMKLSGEWLIFKVANDEKYTTYQRYVPLAPTAQYPGKLLDLNTLSSNINKRNRAKSPTQTSNRTLASDFYTIWESDWPAFFLITGAKPLLDKLQKNNSSYLNEISFLQNYLSCIKAFPKSSERVEASLPYFYELRGEGFPHRGYVDISHSPSNIVHNLAPLNRKKLALMLYKTWVDLTMPTIPALRKNINFHGK